MTQPIHRNNDLRDCGAHTIVVGQTTVFANGKLVSVDKDPNDHGNGNLIAKCKRVYVNSKMVVIVTNDAKPDNAPHGDPKADQGSPNIIVGEQ